MRSRNKHSKENIELARKRLAGGRGVARDDSDDELGIEDHPWQYVYSPDESKIVGAKMGDFDCQLGDTLLLKAEGTKEAWVGLVCQFGDMPTEETDDEVSTEKAAHFMWFSTDREIHNARKKRGDSLPHELYITPSWDWNPLTTINGKAIVLSDEAFQTQFPSYQIPRTSSAFGKTFMCRRACNTRTANYSESFDWSDIYSGEATIDNLIEYVKSATRSSRKRLRDVQAKDDYIPADERDIRPKQPQTPSRRRQGAFTTTPKKRDLPASGHLTTPASKRIMVRKPLEYSPLATRILSPHVHSSPFQRARSQLHVSSVPTSLPCREEAFTTVYTHLEAAIVEGVGSCIYISGTPGTGKTATVREVVNKLDAAVQSEEMEDFIFVEINGMKLTDPQQAYVQLWQALRGETVSASHALTLLEREFGNPNPRRVPCVVLMDELDQLITKNQNVMYNFFNWPSLRHSRLIVLAVANTMDLPERTLSNKISSRLGLIRIPFAGYTHADLMKIIQSRLEGVPGNVVEPDAIQFASRKVAAVSGDARRALDICRRAVEIAEGEMYKQSAEKNADGSNNSQGPAELRPQRVTIATIKRAITEATASPIQQLLKGLSLSSKLLISAFMMRSRRTGLAESSLSDIVEQARRLSSISEEAWLRGLLLPVNAMEYTTSTPAGRLLARPAGLNIAAEELIESGVITMEARRGDRIGRVRLNLAEEEVRQALKDDVHVGKLGFAI